MPQIPQDGIDRGFMGRALRLARRGTMTTAPNPRVGCVLVSAGEIVGEGWHRVAGGDHAEVIALRQAGDRALGATAYVTLEPCSHTGRTPPCVDSLIAARVGRVVVAMEDPTPLVRGRGLAALRAAGIEVSCGTLAVEARALNRGFCARMLRSMPFVFAKLASSIDGRTAMANGESKWITSPAARQQVQRMRAASCAIVTGVDTVLQDDPALTVREDLLGAAYPEDVIRQPLRVIVDSRLRTHSWSRILKEPGEVVIATLVEDRKRIRRFEALGCEVVTLPRAGERVSMPALLKWLAEQRCCKEVMVESGPRLVGSLLSDGLLDEIHLFMAPTLLGSSARPLVELPLVHMGEQLRLDLQELRAVGDDCWMRLVPSRRRKS